MQNQQIYYLISEEDLTENPNYTKIMFKYEFVCLSHINNFFEVIHLKNNMYNIIKIHKNEGLDGKFKINDIIYFDGGVVKFYTKDTNDKINQIECFPTVLIEKEKITLFDEM